MPVKIKTDLKLLKNLGKDVRKRFNDEVSDGAVGKELISTLRTEIQKGQSPVEGEGRFQKYSESYRDQIDGKLDFFTRDGIVHRIERKSRDRTNGWFRRKYPEKKKSPVSMKLTGEMLKSLRLVNQNGKVFLVFDDKKAAWHQKGAGKLPVRKLLPQRGEKFTKRITQLIIKGLRNAVRATRRKK